MKNLIHESLITAQTPLAQEGNDFYDIVGKIIDFGVKIIGIIPYTIARIVDNFIDHENSDASTVTSSD